MSCQTNLINPFNIQWLHNGHLIDKDKYLVHFYDRNILRIYKAIDENAGIYQCFSNESLNHQFIMSIPVTVTIRRKPFSLFSLKIYENKNYCYFKHIQVVKLAQ